MGWEPCPVGRRPASQFRAHSTPTRGGLDSPSRPLPLKPHPGKPPPTAPDPRISRLIAPALPLAPLWLGPLPSACFSSVPFSGSPSLHLYRLRVQLGPALLSLGVASQASTLNSKFKDPLSASQSHTGVQQSKSSSDFTWPKQMEFPLKNLPFSPNLFPNSVKDDTSPPPRCSGKKPRNCLDSLVLSHQNLSALSPNASQSVHSPLHCP